MSGILFGVGLGPGDPDLMTVKAARLIREARVIAYPALPGTQSMARSIASGFIGPDVSEIVMNIPMTAEREPAQAAYDAAAAKISAQLERGENVVCLCEGDPFLYGSFMYLYARLSKNFAVEVVPGVTSITACAALAGRPLVARNEVVTIIPGPLAEDQLRERTEQADTVVLMKVGRHLFKLRAVLRELGLEDRAIYIERATLPDERRLPLADAPETAPYFSMILVTKGADPWL